LAYLKIKGTVSEQSLECDKPGGGGIAGAKGLKKSITLKKTLTGILIVILLAMELL